MVADAGRLDELARATFPTPADAALEDLLAELATRIAELARAAGPGQLRSVGLSVPGQVDARGNFIRAGKLKRLQDVHFQAEMERRLGIPVAVERDANAAAIGEAWRGCARRVMNFVFLALGTGVGAGLVLDGRLHRGAHFAAGEAGDLVFDRAALTADAPDAHNVGAHVGGVAIRERAHMNAGRHLGAADAIRGAGYDARLEPLADEVADDVALAVVAISALVDPELVVLGGGTAVAGADLVDRVSRRVAHVYLSARPRILASPLGADAQLHGALLGALGRIDPRRAADEGLL